MLVTSRDLLHAGPLLTSLPPMTISLFPIIKSLYFGDPWVAQRFGACLGPGRDPGDPGSNPTSGSWCMEPASPSACVSASLFLSL